MAKRSRSAERAPAACLQRADPHVAATSIRRPAFGGIVRNTVRRQGAFINGAARGQGQSHAVRFEEEGADTAVDCVHKSTASTIRWTRGRIWRKPSNRVEKTGHRTVAEQADARDFEKLKFVVAASLSEFDRIDFVLADAVIMPIIGEKDQETSTSADAVHVVSSASATPLRRTCPPYSSTIAAEPS